MNHMTDMTEIDAHLAEVAREEEFVAGILELAVQKAEKKFGTFDPFADQATQYRFTKYTIDVCFKLELARTIEAGRNPAKAFARHQEALAQLEEAFQEMK